MKVADAAVQRSRDNGGMVIQFPGKPLEEEQPVEHIVIMRDGAQIAAAVRISLNDVIGARGDTIPDALRELADEMERTNWQSNVIF